VAAALRLRGAALGPGGGHACGSASCRFPAWAARAGSSRKDKPLLRSGQTDPVGAVNRETKRISSLRGTLMDLWNALPLQRSCW
jgi:hypothetical protein